MGELSKYFLLRLYLQHRKISQDKYCRPLRIKNILFRINSELSSKSVSQWLNTQRVKKVTCDLSSLPQKISWSWLVRKQYRSVFFTAIFCVWHTYLVSLALGSWGCAVRNQQTRPREGSPPIKSCLGQRPLLQANKHFRGNSRNNFLLGLLCFVCVLSHKLQIPGLSSYKCNLYWNLLESLTSACPSH